MHIQVYSELFVTLAYLKPWYIHHQNHIQNGGIFRTLVYSDH